MNIKYRFLLLLVVSSWVFASSAMARVSIKGCTKQPVATRNIVGAVNFLSENLNDILADPVLSPLTPKHRHSLVNALYYESFPIYCRPREGSDCTKPSGKTISAYASPQDIHIPSRGLVERGIYLCISRKSTGLGCLFDAIIAHELAHLAGLPMNENHRAVGKNINRSGDMVFAFEKAVFNYCQRNK